MAFVFADRVKETTTTTGTGTVTLAGAEDGFQSFSAIGDGNETYYVIEDGTDWEVGTGTYTASGTTLSRDTVHSSSNSGSAVNFSAGTKNVFTTFPAFEASKGATVPLVKAIGTSTSSVAGTEVDLTWSASITNSEISISSADITVNSDGVYTFNVTARQQGNNRVESIVRSYIDTGSGYVEQTDDIASDYTIRNVTQDTGGVTLSTAFSLSSGDKVKFSCEADAGGTASLLTAGTILVAQKVS